MILNIYIIGLACCLIWWGLLAFMVFEENIYNLADEGGKKSIEELREVLNDFNSSNPQLAYFLLTLVVSFLWPIMIPYIIFKKLFG